MRLTLLSRTVASLSCPSSFRSTFALVNNRIFSSLYPHSVKQHRKRKAKVLFHNVIFVIINLTQRPRFFFLRHRPFSCAINYSLLCFLFRGILCQTPEDACLSCWFHTKEHNRGKKAFLIEHPSLFIAVKLLTADWLVKWKVIHITLLDWHMSHVMFIFLNVVFFGIFSFSCFEL